MLLAEKIGRCNLVPKGAFAMKKVVLLESGESVLNALKAAFENDKEFGVCGCSGDGKVGISIINQHKPDIVVLDTVLSGEDGFGVMKYIRQTLPKCSVFVISNFADDNIVSKAIAVGAKYYFVKPVSAEIVCERVKEVMEENSSRYLVGGASGERRRVTAIDEKISNIFIAIGIPPHIMGYRYLRTGIKMAVEEPEIINNVTKKLYPSIAEKYKTTASKVERAIRHAIEVAWGRSRSDAISAIFGVRVYVADERPTNSEFIALVAEKIILDDLT